MLTLQILVYLCYLLCYYKCRVLGYCFIFSISYLPCSCSLKTIIKNFVIFIFRPSKLEFSNYSFPPDRRLMFAWSQIRDARFLYDSSYIQFTGMNTRVCRVGLRGHWNFSDRCFIVNFWLLTSLLTLFNSMKTDNKSLSLLVEKKQTFKVINYSCLLVEKEADI
jgi:hypothetical protein